MKTQKLLSTFLLLFGILSLATAQSKIKGKGPIVKETVALSEIHSIGLGIAANIYLTQSSKQEVVIEGQKNIIENIKKEVKNGAWNIDFERKAYSYNELNIYISLKTIRSLAIGGSGNIKGQTAFNNLKDLEVSIGGAGHVALRGNAQKVEINIGGSGEVNMTNLRADHCTVSIAGNGNCQVDVGEKLDVSIAGMGKVRYSGNPKVSSSIAGMGNVKKL
jgi:hypothetical protein